MFSFIYRGANYSSCTTVGNNNVLWCATTGNWDVDSKMGNCTGKTWEILVMLLLLDRRIGTKASGYYSGPVLFNSLPPATKGTIFLGQSFKQ